MKVIMVMFDTLNRRFLEPYGGCEVMTPNFTRLAGKTVQFQNCYAASLPCIPARREMHTGRYNFLHRSWGPLEPFDDSMPNILKNKGIHTHLVSDHGHYWEAGGATYHTQFTTWDNVRGQEGDPWQAVVGEVPDSDPNFVPYTDGIRKILYDQNLANRTGIKCKEDFPLVKTFNGGIEFIKQNKNRGDWFLQIESFSPHEPFMASEEFKAMYPCDTSVGKRYEWPDYSPVNGSSEEEINQVRYAHFASLSMCDEQLGRVLDLMDAEDMWKDTMLIVNTDHGFMLGEHDFWAKNYMPCYNEIVHIPLFIWDPRAAVKGETREALVQTVDMPVTVLDFFGIEPSKDMEGHSLLPILKEDADVREAGLYGTFGGHICCTDGRYTYMRTPRDEKGPLYEYTLMPTHMMEMFSVEELRTMERHEGFDFTKEVPLMQIQVDSSTRCCVKEDFLFDVTKDPKQVSPINDVDVVEYMEKLMIALLQKNDAPNEIYQRFGFTI
ncbi:MAG: sulfatase [Eubacteriales bacterium]